MRKIIILGLVLFFGCKQPNARIKNKFRMKICNSIGCETHEFNDYRLYGNTYRLFDSEIAGNMIEEITISNGYIVYITPIK